MNPPLKIAIAGLGTVGGGVIKMYSRPQAFLDLLRQTAPKLVKLPTI